MLALSAEVRYLGYGAESPPGARAGSNPLPPGVVERPPMIVADLAIFPGSSGCGSDCPNDAAPGERRRFHFGEVTRARGWRPG
jgi:hypothetical protein